MEKLVHDVNGMLEYPGQAEFLEGNLDLAKLTLGYLDYTLPRGIDYDITLSNVGDAILLTGKASAEVDGECVRCLDPASMDIDSDIEGYFAISEDSDMEGLEEDEFEYLPEDGVIELTDYVVAAIMVEIPITFLCKDDCKGLCPKCGHNLNLGPCDCDQQYDESSPFYVLKDFFKDVESEEAGGDASDADSEMPASDDASAYGIAAGDADTACGAGSVATDAACQQLGPRAGRETAEPDGDTGTVPGGAV